MEEKQDKKEGLGPAMLPFVMRELAEMVMKRKMLSLKDALYYIYSSRLYKALLDERTKLWYAPYSGHGIYIGYHNNIYKKEKEMKLYHGSTVIVKHPSLLISFHSILKMSFHY